MSDYLLPHEIIVEILKRVPSETLVKCTAVCKLWHSIITDPSFVALHQTHSSSFLLLEFCNELTIPNFLHYSLRRDDAAFTYSATLRLPSFPRRHYSVVGPCNGLLCLMTGASCPSVLICNPSVRRYVSLPIPRDYSFLYDCTIGFGFDSVHSDYKVVRISCMMDDDSFGVAAPEVELYSLATGGGWRRFPRGVAPVCYVEGDSSNGFVDGVVHWAAKRWVNEAWYNFVLSFNFENETFGEVLLPDSLASVPVNTAWFSVVGGNDGKMLSLHYVDGASLCSCEIWVMKEYGVVESWNKIFEFSVGAFCFEAPAFGVKVYGVTVPPSVLYVRNSREVLLLMEEGDKRHLYSVDVERKRFTDLQIEEEACTWYLYSGYYSESLVLLKKSRGVVSY